MEPRVKKGRIQTHIKYLPYFRKKPPFITFTYTRETHISVFMDVRGEIDTLELGNLKSVMFPYLYNDRD